MVGILKTQKSRKKKKKWISSFYFLSDKTHQYCADGFFLEKQLLVILYS